MAYSKSRGVGAKGRAKASKTMREFAAGKLKSSSGRTVTKPAQAKAIAMSQARKASRVK